MTVQKIALALGTAMIFAVTAQVQADSSSSSDAVVKCSSIKSPVSCQEEGCKWTRSKTQGEHGSCS